jgi:hypothetical protein
VKNWFSQTYKGEPALEHIDAGIALDARTVPSGKDVHVTTAFTRSEATGPGLFVLITRPATFDKARMADILDAIFKPNR